VYCWQALALAENRHIDELQDARVAAAEDLLAERMRLGSKLDALNAQVRALNECDYCKP
jgi:hypothetical protein